MLSKKNKTKQNKEETQKQISCKQTFHYMMIQESKTKVEEY